eukprot:scaffold47928_cov49-Phaeocystis_antarctica.AAC.5
MYTITTGLQQSDTRTKALLEAAKRHERYKQRCKQSHTTQGRRVRLRSARAAAPTIAQPGGVEAYTASVERGLTSRGRAWPRWSASARSRWRSEPGPRSGFS